MRRLSPVLLAVALLACATPLDRGERLYREGDRLGALAAWRSVPEGDGEHARARERIAEVEEEFDRLVERYKSRARWLERQGRLAESILNYRLALELQPGDAATLAHVQSLARTLAARRAALLEEYERALAAGALSRADQRVRRLRALDAFDPEIETLARRFEARLAAAVDERLARGRQAFLAGRYPEARRHFASVLELDGDHEAARGYLAYLAAVEGEGAPAGAPALESGVFASDAEIRAEGFFRNARAADRDGDPYAAIRYDLRALETDPSHAGARDHLAKLRSRLADSVDVLVDAGRRAFRNEDLQAALEAWRRALLIDPENERARAYVALAERRLADLEKLRGRPAVAAGQE